MYGPQLAGLSVHPETLPFGSPTARKGAVITHPSAGITDSCPQVKHNACNGDLMQIRNGFRLLTLATAMALPMAAPQVANAAVSFVMSVNVAPPAIPVYAQPICPGPGYLWTPGYWAYGPRGYVWTAGTWVRPPAPGVLWTPAYWGWEGGHYRFHAGYWGLMWATTGESATDMAIQEPASRAANGADMNSSTTPPPGMSTKST